MEVSGERRCGGWLWIKIEQILISLVIKGVQREDLDREMKESGQKKM
jgi:hypothetical protein